MAKLEQLQTNTSTKFILGERVKIVGRLSQHFPDAYYVKYVGRWSGSDKAYYDLRCERVGKRNLHFISENEIQLAPETEPFRNTTPSPKEPEVMRMLNPVKIENITHITLSGGSTLPAKDLSNDQLITAIQEAEKAIEELKSIKHKPELVTQRIAELEAGIKSIVALLDARVEESDDEGKKSK